MKLIKGMFGWHSNKQIFKNDTIQLSGKKFTDSQLSLTIYPTKFPPFVNLDCPFFFQDQINTCGDTSVKMVTSFQMLHFKSSNVFSEQLKPINQFLSKSHKRGTLQGTTDDELLNIGMKSVRLPYDIKNNVSYFSSWLAYALYHLGPLIITINIFNGRVPHAVVVKGIENETLLIHDPWYGANQFVHYKNFFEIFDKYSESFMYLPNKFLNTIYKTRENDLVSNLFYHKNPTPVPLLKPSYLIKSVLI